MHYRLYRLNEATGAIVDAADILAESDEEAIRAGHQAHASAPFEIWCRSRLVFTVAPAPAPTATLRTV